MDYLIQPWKHQLTAIERARTMDGFAFFFDPGTGKTCTTINVLRHKMNDRKQFLRTLIFCPPIVIKNWKDEFKLHSKISQDQIVLLTGSGKNRLKLFQENAYTTGPAGEALPTGKIFVTNYEALLMNELFEEMQNWRPQAIVFDESHKLKNHSARRTKLAEALANPYDKRAKAVLPKPLVYLLSGTPVLNTPLDIFSQYLILDGGRTFGANFYAFRARYFRDRNAGMPKDRYFPNWEIIPGALEELNRRITTIGMRADKRDCLDLPPLVEQTISVAMTPEQSKLYKEMRQDMITYLKDKACVATLAITKALRLQQIASGYIKIAEGEEVALQNTPKMEALTELLEELTPHSKVLVWAVWKKNYAEIKRVCEELGIKYVEVHGDISPAQKQKNVEAFLQDQSVRVYIGHPGSGGIGINLVNAAYSIYYSRTFSLEHYDQSKARNYRGGSKEAGHEKITHYHLVCENTIDELTLKKLSEKQEMSFEMLKNIPSNEF